MNTLPHTVYVLYITAEGELSIINTTPQTLSAIYIYIYIHKVGGGGGGGGGRALPYEHNITHSISAIYKVGREIHQYENTASF